MTATAPTGAARPFHTFKPEYVEAMIAKSTLSDQDKELIAKFLNEKKGLANRITKKKGISIGRVKKIYYHLITWRNCAGIDFSQLTFDDVIDTMNRIEEAGKFNQNTMRDHVAIVKMFLVWLADNDKSQLTDKQLKKISIPAAPDRKIGAMDKITEDDKDAMIRASMSPRDKVIISLLWESALRPVEIGQLQGQDVEFTPQTMYITTRGKTGRTRKIPCPVSMIYMKQWYDNAPYKIERDTPVFCALTPTVDKDGVRHFFGLKDDSLREQLKAIAKRAGVKDYKHPYQFRHTAITRYLDAGIPERQVMRISHGGDTRMLGIYYLNDDNQVEDSINTKIHKLPSRREREAKREMEITERICPACGTVHDANFRFCGKCGQPLTEEGERERCAVMAKVESEEYSPQDIQKAISILKALQMGKV